MDLGKRLRQLRLLRNYSLYDVERAVGLHYSTIAKYERNEREPALDVLRDLAALYRVPVAALVSDMRDFKDILSEEQIFWLSAIEGNPRLGELLTYAARAPGEAVSAVLTLLAPYAGGGAGSDDGRPDATTTDPPAPSSPRY